MRSAYGESGYGFGEPELDANTALTELDKGLRSVKLGEQVEAIVRFPTLFERYPFPILINSAFLKLADVFRTGTNFLRLWVLRVCEQSERHLDKILNVDEFVKRIFSVILSNDPIARALTLRTLGSLCGLISEDKKVHHSIRAALDSHDRVEVSAAICAASAFAQKSKTFGTTMCTKIATMVQRLSTPLDMKLRLIPIFQYMHHDVATASMVRKLCQDLLVNYPSQQFVITTQHTLTQLAAATISDLTEQVTFLLQYLRDSRVQVKLSVLKDLKYLGEKGGHLWESEHIDVLIKSILQRNDWIIEEKMEIDNEQDTANSSPIDAEIDHATLDAINSVTSSSAILIFIRSGNSPLWRLLEKTIHSTNMSIALKSIQIATCIAINWKDEKCSLPSGKSLIEMACTGVESLLTSLCSQDLDGADESFKVELYKDLEKCLHYGVMLCKADPSKCDWYTGLLLRLFRIPQVSARIRNLISQGIGAVGSNRQDSIQAIVLDLVNILKKMGANTINAEGDTVATLVAVIFQSHQGFEISPKAMAVLNSVLNISNMWLAYRLARNSLRYGQPELAVTALSEMASAVSSESFNFWLSSLYGIAKAEKLMSESDQSSEIIQQLSSASNLYIQSVVSLKAASSNTMLLTFQTEFVKIRSEMLVAFSNFLISCNALQHSPPPAIAQSIAINMRDELLKSGRIITQLRKSVVTFQNISEMYGRLYQTAFDADDDSLLNIQTLQQMCRLIARSIEKLVVSKDHPSFTNDNDQAATYFNDIKYAECGNTWSLIIACRKASEKLQEIKTVPSQALLSFHQVDCLREAAKILIQTPIPYPRFFFQTLQITRTKIAVSPQPRIPGESVSVLHGNNFLLKVEGVTQQNTNKSDPDICASKHRATRAVFRKPKAVKLTVISTPIPNPRTLAMMEHLKINPEPTTMVVEVVPKRDYFQAKFLLLVVPGGLINVVVDTSLVDFEGRVWSTGPRASLSVRVFDDPNAPQLKSTGQQSHGLPVSSRQMIGGSSMMPGNQPGLGMMLPPPPGGPGPMMGQPSRY